MLCKIRVLTKVSQDGGEESDTGHANGGRGRDVPS